MTNDTHISSPSEILHRILAIDPSAKGFGYIVLESPDQLLDWGLKETCDEKNAKSLRQIEGLVKLYSPSLIAIENIRASDSRRGARVRVLLSQVSSLGRKLKTPVRAVSKSELKKSFESSRAKTKDEIAQVIAKRFPELALRLPPPRKPWNGPDPRMAIFMAMANALAALQHDDQKAEAPRSLKD